MSKNDFDYHKMKDEESSKKLKITRGDIIISNKDNDYFLLFFSPKNIDIQCFCGCDLNRGMKVVCGFIFYLLAFHFFHIILENNYRTYFVSTFLCACYLISLFNMFQTMEELSYEKAIFNYRFFALTFFFEIISVIAQTIYLILYEPLYFSTSSYLGIILSYSGIVITLLIEGYMIWITFCFMEHIKNNRLYLLKDYNNIDLFTSLV